jgi:hypothetical protein
MSATALRRSSRVKKKTGAQAALSNQTTHSAESDGSGDSQDKLDDAEHSISGKRIRLQTECETRDVPPE